jgi:hypothetical protein
MNRRPLIALLVACGLAPSLLEHFATASVSGDGHHHGWVDSRFVGGRSSLLPGLRALIVQLWLVRIDTALHQNDRARALRLTREALAVGPDLVFARARIAQVLAFDVAGHEATDAARVGWIGESLRVLDEGLARDPSAAPLHLARGIVLWLRGTSVPEFAAEYRRATHRDSFDAAVESFVRAVELARFDYTTLFYAISALTLRAETALSRAKAAETSALAGDAVAEQAFFSDLEAARADYALLAEYTATQVALLDEPAEFTLLAAQHAVVSAELLDLECRRLLRGETVDMGRVEALRNERRELTQSLEAAVRH